MEKKVEFDRKKMEDLQIFDKEYYSLLLNKYGIAECREGNITEDAEFEIVEPKRLPSIDNLDKKD